MAMLSFFSNLTEYSWIFVGMITFMCLYLWYRRPNNFPPGPRGIPIAGAFPFMGKYPERQMKKWSKKYGPVMSVRLGLKDVVVLNDFQSIHQAFVKQHSIFSGRPQFPFLQQITEGNGIVFVDNTDSWKRQRKFGLMTLRGFGVGKRNMENKILEEASYMNEAIRNKNGKPFDISHLLRNAASNNICSVIFGKRFQYDDERFKEIIYRLNRSVDDPISSFVSTVLTFLPFLMYIPPFSFYNGYVMDDVKVVLKMLREIVKEHEDTFHAGDIRDFIDAFIVEIKKKEDPGFSHLQLLHFVRDLFVAGTDTTASTLYWSLLCLLHHPEAQEKVYKEVVEVVGRNGVVSMSNRPCLPYVNAFVEETYRFRTLVPLGLTHKASEDVDFQGYFIPKGTMVSSNLWAVHNDEAMWEEPEKFRPERFLDERGNFVHSNHVLAFSVGSRHCLGEQLARAEIFIFFVSMIQKFQFLPDPAANKLPDIESGSNGLTFVPHPYELVAKER